MDDKGIKELSESLKGGLDETDFTNMKRQIEYISSKAHGLTKIPTKGYGTPSERWEAYHDIIQTIKERFETPELIEEHLKTIAESSKKGFIEYLRERFDLLEEDSEEVVETAVEKFRDIFEGIISRAEKELDVEPSKFKDLTLKLDQLLSELRREIPTLPATFLKDLVERGYNEDIIKKILFTFLGDIIGGEEVYYSMITEELREKLREKLKVEEGIDPLGTKKLMAESWSKTFSEFIFEKGKVNEIIQKKFLDLVEGEEWDIETVRESVLKFISKDRPSAIDFTKFKGMREAFEEFFKTYELKPGEWWPSAIFYSILDTISGEKGVKHIADMVTLLNEKTIPSILETLEGMGVKIPRDFEKILESFKGEIIPMEFKLVAGELVADLEKWADRVITMAIYQGKVSEEIAGRTVILKASVLEEMKEKLTPKQREELHELAQKQRLEEYEELEKHVSSTLKLLREEGEEPEEEVEGRISDEEQLVDIQNALAEVATEIDIKRDEKIEDIMNKEETKSSFEALNIKLSGNQEALDLVKEVVSSISKQQKEFLTKLFDRLYGDL